MRSAFILAALAASSILTGCTHAAVVQPGHRGILFDPMNGLKHEVLPPGYYHLANGCKAMKCPRGDDFDVTYSTSKEHVQAHSSEGLGLDTSLAVIYRPVISELFELDTEVGSNFYEEVVGHEVRSATIGVLARHSYTELRVHNREIEDEIQKAFLENDALKNKLQLEHASEQAQLKARLEAEQLKLSREAEAVAKGHELE